MPQAQPPALLQLVFRGECLPGHEPAAVRAALAAALRLDEPRTARLFSGRRTVLRRGVDEAKAHRTIARFAMLGARLRAEPSQPRPAALRTPPERARRLRRWQLPPRLRPRRLRVRAVRLWRNAALDLWAATRLTLVAVLGGALALGLGVVLALVWASWGGGAAAPAVAARAPAPAVSVPPAPPMPAAVPPTPPPPLAAALPPPSPPAAAAPVAPRGPAPPPLPPSEDDWRAIPGSGGSRAVPPRNAARAEAMPVDMGPAAQYEYHQRYARAGGRKAFAISGDGGFGWHGGADTDALASQTALQRCIAASRNRACRVVEANGQWLE